MLPKISCRPNSPITQLNLLSPSMTPRLCIFVRLIFLLGNNLTLPYVYKELYICWLKCPFLPKLMFLVQIDNRGADADACGCTAWPDVLGKCERAVFVRNLILQRECWTQVAFEWNEVRQRARSSPTPRGSERVMGVGSTQLNSGVWRFRRV